jgi:large subunit ribosomal protein LP0
MPTKKERKEGYFTLMKGLLAEHTKAFLVHADHVGSKQFMDIRKALRGTGTVLMGKNTMMRRIIADLGAESPFRALIPILKGNVGLIFVKSDLSKAKGIVRKYTVPAPAKAGVVANSDVVVPPGPTGCDPSQTGYFQAMDVPTKITKGQIEIAREVPLIKRGDRVTPGQADLLQKLSINPFTYGLEILKVFDSGDVFDPNILDINDADIISAITSGARNVAALSFAIGIANAATVPHSIRNAIRALIAVVVADGITFTVPQAAEVVAYLKEKSA